jgi:hypothetical protein
MADNAITAGLSAFDAVQGIKRRMAEDEWRKQKEEAELSNLETKTRAERSGYELKDSENNAGLEMMPLWKNAQQSNLNNTIGENESRAQVRPSRTLADVSSNALRVDQNEAAQRALPTKMQAEMSGYENTIDANQAAGQVRPSATNAAISTNKNTVGLNYAAASTRPLETENKMRQNTIDAKTLDYKLTELPKVWAQQYKTGALNDQSLNDKVIGTMGHLIRSGDKQGLINFANSVTAEGGVLPETNGHKVVDVLQDKQGGGYQFVYEDGAGNTKTTQTVPASRFQDAMTRVQPSDFTAHTSKDGTIVAVDKRGNSKIAYKPEQGAMGQEHKPAEVKTAEWLIQNGVAKDANQAWNLVSSAKEKTRSSFVMDYVAKNAMPGQDTSKIAQQAGTIYDTLKQSEGPAPTQSTQGSNNPQGDKLLKKLNLGVP